MAPIKIRETSPQKLEANRRNAQRSTGPRTQEGKERSRRNARKHGILTSALLITEGKGWENEDEFTQLLAGLRENLSPEGTLEDLLVQKIAICCWRQRRALECEAQLCRRQRLRPMDCEGLTIEALDDGLRCAGLSHDKEQGEDEGNTEVEDLMRRPRTLRESLRLPSGRIWIKSSATKQPFSTSWSTRSTSWNACSGHAKASRWRLP